MKNIFNRLLTSECLVSTLHIGLIGFILYLVLIKSGVEVAVARTYLLTFMVFFENIQSFNCRNEYISAFKCGFKNNPALVMTIIGSFVFHISAIYIAPLSRLLNITPIRGLHVFYILLLSFTQIIVMEIFKFFLRRKANKSM